MQLSTIQHQGADLIRAVAQAQWQHLTGRAAVIDFPKVYREFGILISNESFAAVQEACVHAHQETDQRHARHLLGLVVMAREGAQTALSRSEFQRLASKPSIRCAGEFFSLNQLHRRLMNEPSRPQRVGLALAGLSSLPATDRPLVFQVNQRQKLADELGFSSYEALWSQAFSVDLPALADEAQTVLAHTKDALADLLDFGLRQVVGGGLRLRPRGDASLHDFQRFARLSPWDDLFREPRLLDTARAFLESWGWSPHAHGRIDFDLEANGRTEGKKKIRPEGAAAVPLNIPQEVSLVMARSGGAADYRAFFQALGQAHHWTLTDPALPFADRCLGDSAVNHSYAALFGHLLTNAGFIQRYLTRDHHQAAEAARLMAIERLANLRVQCATLIYLRALYATGPKPDIKNLYRELMEKAIFVDWPADYWLWNVEPGFEPANVLRGLCLAARLEETLLELANEDWWRNPRAGRFLEQLFRRGQRDSASTLAQELNRPLSLANAADRLIAIAAR